MKLHKIYHTRYYDIQISVKRRIIVYDLLWVIQILLIFRFTLAKSVLAVARLSSWEFGSNVLFLCLENLCIQHLTRVCFEQLTLEKKRQSQVNTCLSFSHLHIHKSKSIVEKMHSCDLRKLCKIQLFLADYSLLDNFFPLFSPRGNTFWTKTHKLITWYILPCGTYDPASIMVWYRSKMKEH